MIRLRKLDLERFGHFAGKSFDFGPRPDGADFHVIHGPNEAGKTTTMEGWLRLLYGFDAREAYDFRHNRKNLVVSGLLEIDGTPRLFRRLPLRKNALVDEHGTALSEAALAAHLGGLDAVQYRDLLCLDDDTIERGGEEIVQSKGDIGRLLFSAAAGIGDLTPVLDRLGDAAEALYKKNSGKTRFAELRKALKETEAQIAERDVSASAFRKLRADLRAAQAEEEAAATERKQAHRDEAWVGARIDALPLLTQLDALDDALAALAHLPSDPGIDPDHVLSLMQAQTKAESDQARLQREIEALTEAHDALQIDPADLAPGPDLEALEPLRQRVRAAAPDLDKRRAEVTETLAEMARVASDLSGTPVGDPQGFVVAPAELAVLETAREALRDAQAQTGSEAREIADLEDRLAAARQRLDLLEAEAPEGADLTAFLEDTPLDQRETQQAAAEQARTRHAEAVHSALDALALPGQTFTDLPAPHLTVEEAEDALQRLRLLEQKLEQLQTETDTLETRAAVQAARNAALTQSGTLADDAQAAAARAERDALWQTHLDRLDSGSARDFHAAMLADDAIAAARLSHADRLAALRQGESQSAEIAAELKGLAPRRAALEQEAAALRDTLDAAQRDAGLTSPLQPATLPGWLRKLDAARAALGAQARAQAEAAPLEAELTRTAAELRRLLGSDSTDFGHLAGRARTVLNRWTAHRDRMREARGQQQSLAQDLQTRQTRLTRLQASRDVAQEAWQTAISTALPDTGSAARLLASLAPLNTLRELDQKRRNLARQITGMERDIAALTDAMNRLSPGDTPAEMRFDDLDSRYRAAEQNRARQQTLSEQLESARAALTEAEQSLTDIAAARDDLAKRFPDGPEIASLDDLRQAVEACHNAKTLRDNRNDLAARITTRLSVDTLDAAREVLAGQTLSDLEAARSALRADLDRIETTYREAIATRSTARAALDRITGDADIAELTERRALLEMELAETALDHLRLSIGHKMAEDALRRYRDTHRSGMMQATESAFAALTNGAYTRLQTIQDGKAETLVALDAQGVAKAASDLSKGTRFQLYLALRAAAYEQLAAQNVCLPFFCDDIFETFDEDRTRAACAVMRRIGMTGQAIYLTHHRHVVDIARDVCGDSVQIHTL